MTEADLRDGGLDPEIDQALVEGHADPATYETFNNWFFDGERGIGLNIYLLYVRGGLARERAALFLPDGRTCFALTEGHYSRGDQPGGSSLSLRRVEPFRRWTYHWHGAAYAIQRADELKGLVTDSTPVRIETDLTVDTVTEPWLIPLSSGPATNVGAARVKGEFLGKYEQIARATGIIHVDGKNLDFDGVGLRAHVRGPRDVTGMGSHAWLCGLFPSGKGFGVKQLFDEQGAAYFSEAYLSEGSHIRHVSIRSVPPISRDNPARRYAFELDDGGEIVRIEGEDCQTTWIPIGSWRQRAGNSLQQGSGLFNMGHGLVREAPRLMCQGTARFFWDGETGYGMSEFSG